MKRRCVTDVECITMLPPRQSVQEYPYVKKNWKVFGESGECILVWNGISHCGFLRWIEILHQLINWFIDWTVFFVWNTNRNARQDFRNKKDNTMILYRISPVSRVKVNSLIWVFLFWSILKLNLWILRLRLGPCPKVCKGLFVSNIETVQKLRGCTTIDGDLEMQIKGGDNIIQELERSLGSIEVIRGVLKITRSFPILSLSFFKSLRNITGKPEALHSSGSKNFDDEWVPTISGVALSSTRISWKC